MLVQLTPVALMASLLVGSALNPFLAIRLSQLLVAILSVIHAGQVNFLFFLLLFVYLFITVIIMKIDTEI